MNKMCRNLIKIRSCVIFSWFFYTASNALLTPLLFIFYFPPPPQFYYFPSSNFLFPPPPPPPHFYCFPSSSSSSFFIVFPPPPPPPPHFYCFPSTTTTTATTFLLFSLHQGYTTSISMFPEAGEENIEIRDFLYSWKFIKPRCNGGRWSTFAGKSALLPSNVINFAMLPAQRFWWETVSLFDVMWPWSKRWERALIWKRNF